MTRLGWTLTVALIIVFASLFTYATRDVCYVGGNSNLGYGSCR
jgi:hypothetical protein